MTPTATELAAWIASAAFLVVLGNGLFTMWRNLNGSKRGVEVSPQPLSVTAVSGMASETTCRDRYDRLQSQIEELKQDRKTDVNDLHEKVNGVAREVSEMSAAQALTNQRLVQIDAKIDRVIERQLPAAGMTQINVERK